MTMMTKKSLATAAALSLIAAAFAAAGGAEEGTVATAATMSTGQYNEAPVLAALVAAGELPPVDERLPDEPKVKEVVEEIGQYGGTINAFAINMDSWNDMGEVIGGSSFLLDITADNEIVPDLAKGYELAPDGKSMTLSLRPGAKWSDGHPFTADDIVFMFEDMHWNDEVSTWNLYGRVNRIRKIDDYTVRFEMDNPYPVLPVVMVTWPGGEIASYAPKHYLQKWHIKYNENADALAKEEGFDSWWEAFNSHQIFYPTTDTDQPTTMPWKFENQTATVKYFQRNPYFYQVDPAGNQLPYIDDVVVTAVNKEVYQAKIMSGESDIAVALTSMENYSLYKENEQSGGYRVIAVPGVNASEAAFSINQNYPDAALREIFNDVRFRRALSAALDREEINETVYFGLGTPRQATTLPNASFYKPEWGEAHPYLAYAPDTANGLLDAIGLTARDADGFRLGPDGEALVLLLEYPESFPDPTMFELMKEYWEDVGLKILIKGELAWALFGERTRALDHMLMVHPYQTVGEIAFLVEPFRPRVHGVKEAPAWEAWMEADRNVNYLGTQTMADYEDGKFPGEEPPAHIKEQYYRVEEATSFPLGSEEYKTLMQEIYDYNAEYLYHLGTIGLAPKLHVVDNNLRNIPDRFGADAEHGLELYYEAQQFFWKK